MIAKDNYLMLGDNRASFVRLAPLGHGSAEEPDRPGVRDLLAARAHRLQVRVSSASISPRPTGASWP